MDQYIARRKQSRLSQSDVAARSGLPKSSISIYENHGRDPGSATLERLAKGVGLRVLLLDIGHASPVAEHGGSIAAAVANGDEHQAFEVLRAIAFELMEASPGEAVVLSYQEPASINAQWDAAIAGVVEWRLQQAGAPVPDWVTACRRDRADRWTPLTAVPSDTTTVSDVAALAKRGILIHSLDLELD